MSLEALAGALTRLAPVCLAGFVLALLFLPALRWPVWPRAAAGGLLGTALLLAPLIIGPEQPLDRAIAAVFTGTWAIKMYDVYRGASFGSILPLRRYLLFLVIPFCHVARLWDDAPIQPRRQSLRRVLRGSMLGAAAGASLIIFDLGALGAVSFLLEHSARITLIFAAVAGCADAAFGLYCLARGRGWPLFENFFLSRSPAEFWRRYNMTVTQYMFENVFRPCGGARAPIRATLAAFFFSGVLHEYIASIALARVQGFQMAFFMVQGLAVAATQRLRPRGAWAAIGVASTAAFMLVTSMLFAASAARMFRLYSAHAPAWIQPLKETSHEPSDDPGRSRPPASPG